jgi:molybdopterin converting factor small subunit
MPKVRFTSHLQRFFPKLSEVEVEGETVAELLKALEKKFPGLSAYIVDQKGSLRQHVNIFVREELILDRITLSDPVEADDPVYILQALSGGIQ